MPGRRQHGEGSIYHRKDRGQWVAVADLGYRGGRRDRREFTGPTPEKAMDRRAAFLARRRDGFTLPRGRQPTVAEWAEHWLWNIAKPAVDPSSFYKSYRQKVQDYIVPYFDRVPLAGLSEEDIERWHQELLARPLKRGSGTLSPSTIETAHRILSRALNVAVARHRIPHNPCSFVPPPKHDRPPPEPPSADEVAAVLAACRERPGGARWILAVCTGLRQGEALGLRWRDVRLTAPASVTVSQARKRIEGEVSFAGPKSRKSRRTVPLPKIAVTALKTHRDQAVAAIGGLVFTRPDGAPLGDKADWQDWADLLAELGLPHYRPHDLRHAYATMLLEGGMDPRLVQDLMGWSTAAMAQVYQHVRPVLHERAVSMLDQVLGDG